MKSRMAITSMLVLGVLAGGTGTGLAVSGVSDSGSAGKAQYPPGAQALEDNQGGGGGGQSPGGGEGPGGGGESPDVLGKEEADDTDVAGTRESGGQGGGGQSGVQATRQVSVQKDGELPFTGLAAIPLILIGVGLLATGVVLHRRLPESA